jgi:hypothetical protein
MGTRGELSRCLNLFTVPLKAYGSDRIALTPGNLELTIPETHKELEEVLGFTISKHICAK